MFFSLMKLCVSSFCRKVLLCVLVVLFSSGELIVRFFIISSWVLLIV